MTRPHPTLSRFEARERKRNFLSPSLMGERQGEGVSIAGSVRFHPHPTLSRFKARERELGGPSRFETRARENLDQTSCTSTTPEIALMAPRVAGEIVQPPATVSSHSRPRSSSR